MKPVTHRTYDPFVGERSQSDNILIFPLRGELCDLEQVEQAAMGLPELALLPSENNNQKIGGSTCILTIEDYERLWEGEWLNDEIMYWFGQWISRGVDPMQSPVLILSTRVYNNLTNHRLEDTDKFQLASSHWPMQVKCGEGRAKITIHPLLKNMILIPVNTNDEHWSLAILLNPRMITDTSNYNDDGTLGIRCMLYLDSKSNDVRAELVHKNIDKWLQSMMSPQGLGHYQTIPLCTPKVPQQTNNDDCGVFTCRFVYAMFQLRNRTFTSQDLSDGFLKSITDHHLFAFGTSQISSLRTDMKTLVRRLSIIYMKGKLGFKSKILKGTPFQKVFDGVKYSGTVGKYLKLGKVKVAPEDPFTYNDPVSVYYHVSYKEDSDAEDITEAELVILLHQDQKRQKNKKIINQGKFQFPIVI